MTNYPDDKRKLRIQSSEALKNIMSQKRRIHRLFEKKIPKVVAKSFKFKNNPSLNLNNLPTQTPLYIQTQSSPIKTRSSLTNANDDLTDSLNRRVYTTSVKFTSWSTIQKNSARIRGKAATPDFFYKALNTVFKEPKKNISNKKLPGPKVSRIVL